MNQQMNGHIKYKKNVYCVKCPNLLIGIVIGFFIIFMYTVLKNLIIFQVKECRMLAGGSRYLGLQQRRLDDGSVPRRSWWRPWTTASPPTT